MTISIDLFVYICLNAHCFYYRMLLNDFFNSSSQFLSDHGEIHIALCEGQGGSTAASLQEWKSTWTPSLFAAEHGLVLLQVLPFKVCCDAHSRRIICVKKRIMCKDYSLILCMYYSLNQSCLLHHIQY